MQARIGAGFGVGLATGFDKHLLSFGSGLVLLRKRCNMYVLVMMISGRYTHRLYVAYCTLYTLGTLLSMQIRFVGFQAVQSSEHMAAASTFVIIQVYAFANFLKHLSLLFVVGFSTLMPLYKGNKFFFVYNCEILFIEHKNLFRC